MDARWNKGVGPAAAGMSAAKNHHAEKKIEYRRASIFIRPGTVEATGKKSGNQQYPGEGMHLLLPLLPGGKDYSDAR